MKKKCLSCKKELKTKVDPDDETTFFCDRICFEDYQANLVFQNLDDPNEYKKRLQDLGVEDV